MRHAKKVGTSCKCTEASKTRRLLRRHVMVRHAHVHNLNLDARCEHSSVCSFFFVYVSISGFLVIATLLHFIFVLIKPPI